MNIIRAIEIIADHLSNYDPGLDGKVHIMNIAEEPKAAQQDGSISISLIKVEEEPTLKNGKLHRLDNFNKVEFKNRPVFTNLYLLFCCYDGIYSTALANLTKVIEFFQSKNIFTPLDGLEGETPGESYRLIMDLQNLTFEQVNHIWGFLGGKQKPSVLYKCRIVPIEAKDKISNKGEPILEINLESETKLQP